MSRDMTLEEMAQTLRTYSRGQLLSALHKRALKYAAQSESVAKKMASAGGSALTPRTGHLVQSITGRAKKGKGEIVIALNAGGGRNDVKYAKVHEQDGKRGSFFTIRPKNFNPASRHPGKLVFPVSADAFTPVGVARGGGAGSRWAVVDEVKIPARPFLRPTWLLMRKLIKKDVNTLLSEELLK